jgi:hypothetical protein
MVSPQTPRALALQYVAKGPQRCRIRSDRLWRWRQVTALPSRQVEDKSNSPQIWSISRMPVTWKRIQPLQVVGIVMPSFSFECVQLVLQNQIKVPRVLFRSRLRHTPEGKPGGWPVESAVVGTVE